MGSPTDNLLTRVLLQPLMMSELTVAQWNKLIPQARHAILLGKLGVLIDQADIEQSIPAAALNHIRSAQIVSQKQIAIVHWEAYKIGLAMSAGDIPCIVLKGAAYIIGGLPASEGRLLSDIDLLVDKVHLEKAESVLVNHGWMPKRLNSYDDKYYRQWMHEVPPMTHGRRGSTIDLHHTILPLTCRYRPDPAKLFEAMQATEQSHLYLPSGKDMIIHSAAHLFHDGEFEHGLRDLVDIDSLLCFFAEKEAGFWPSLVARAVELDLIRPLYYALRYCRIILETPIPDSLWPELENAGSNATPNVVMAKVMDFLFLRGLAPNHRSADVNFTGWARTGLYIRAHYLRMPLYLLIPHLVRKAWRRQFQKEEEPDLLLPKQN